MGRLFMATKIARRYVAMTYYQASCGNDIQQNFMLQCPETRVCVAMTCNKLLMIFIHSCQYNTSI